MNMYHAPPASKEPSPCSSRNPFDGRKEWSFRALYSHFPSHFDISCPSQALEKPRSPAIPVEESTYQLLFLINFSASRSSGVSRGHTDPHRPRGPQSS